MNNLYQSITSTFQSQNSPDVWKKKKKTGCDIDIKEQPHTFETKKYPRYKQKQPFGLNLRLFQSLFKKLMNFFLIENAIKLEIFHTNF